MNLSSLVNSVEVAAAASSSSSSSPCSSPPSTSSSFASLDAANTVPQRKLVPFLKKMQTIIAKTPRSVGEWSPNGLQYNVLDSEAFALAIQSHFKSSTKTFCRQLFYYGFSTIPARDGGGDGQTSGTYSIYHSQLQRDDPSKLFEIKRLHKPASKSLPPLLAPLDSPYSTSSLSSSSFTFPSNPQQHQLDDLDHVLALQKTMGMFDAVLGDLKHKVEAIQQIIAQQPSSPKRLHTAFEVPPVLGLSSNSTASDDVEFESAAASAAVAEGPNTYNWRAWEVERAESSVWDLELMDLGDNDVQWNSMLLTDKLVRNTKQA